MITRERRAVESDVYVCHCDRCGAECPKLNNRLSGSSSFDHGELTVFRPAENPNQRGTFLLGRPHEDEIHLCLACVDALAAWLKVKP